MTLSQQLYDDIFATTVPTLILESAVLTFIVRGSSNSEYRIEAHRTGDIFRISCTCTGARNGRTCKHRLALLRGDMTAVLSKNESEISALQAMFSGSGLEQRIKKVRELELLHDAIKKQLDSEKRARDREMNE